MSGSAEYKAHMSHCQSIFYSSFDIFGVTN